MRRDDDIEHCARDEGPRMDKIKTYAPHLHYILPALAFAAAGTGKLSGNPDMLGAFADMGLPPLFGTFIGACEVAGAVGLIWAHTRILAAAGLIIIMFQAIYYHAAYGVPSPVPAIVLTLLLAATIWVFDARTRRRSSKYASLAKVRSTQWQPRFACIVSTPTSAPKTDASKQTANGNSVCKADVIPPPNAPITNP